MRFLSRLTLFFLGAFWMLPSIAVDASELSNMVAAPTVESFFYLFQAELLGNPDDVVEARVEYRAGDSILATRVLPLRLGVLEERLVSFPSPQSFLADRIEGKPIEVHVLVGDFLLSVLDPAAMDQAAKALSYRFPENLPLRALRESIQRREAEAKSSESFLEVVVDSIQCESSGGCGPYGDYDHDGVINMHDNCTDDPNANQRDCDNDGAGDVCDGLNGVFQATGSAMTCMTDKDTKPWGNKWEHHVEQRQRDVTSCGSPDRWSRWIRSYGGCSGWSNNRECCINSIGLSIEQVGDDDGIWCGDSKRNIDFCR